MSPTEFDLRAALHDGEGDGPDIDETISTARAQRSRRRARLLSGAAAVVVVAGLATGAAAIHGGNGTNDDHSSTGDYGAAAGGANPAAGVRSPSPSSAGAAAASNTAQGTASSATAGPSCPAALPHLMLPGGGGTGQFGGDGPLFASTPVSIVVCAYGTATQQAAGAVPARLVLTGSQAIELTESVENALTTPSTSTACTTNPGRSLLLLGVTSTGATMRAVTADIDSCNGKVTNGTAVRYAWTPPSDLEDVLTSLTPRVATTHDPALPSHGPGSGAVGSPVR